LLSDIKNVFKVHVANSDGSPQQYHSQQSSSSPSILDNIFANITFHTHMGLERYKFPSYNDEGYPLEASAKLTFNFPSVEERVQYYMGRWYDGESSSLFHVTPDGFCREVPLFQDSFEKIADTPYIFNESNIQVAIPKKTTYATDVLEYFIQLAPHPSTYRVIVAFGDEQLESRSYPLVQRGRKLSYPERYDNMIALMGSARFYKPTRFEKAINDKPFQEKRDGLVWRGATTGGKDRFRVVWQYFNATDQGIDIGFHKLVQQWEGNPYAEQLLLPEMTTEQLLDYKFLLSMEGNDIASGLNWMLLSNSVVLMAPPKFETFAMEGKLVPYYHYVPLAPNYSDLVEKLEWARQNEDICKQISLHATEYIYDLYITPKAKNDNREIHRKMASRYAALYGKELSKC
jgi:hypothetical protein